MTSEIQNLEKELKKLEAEADKLAKKKQSQPNNVQTLELE